MLPAGWRACCSKEHRPIRRMPEAIDPARLTADYFPLTDLGVEAPPYSDTTCGGGGDGLVGRRGEVRGRVCEQHPDQPWPHGDCAGPGNPCLNAACPWWQEPSPKALRLARWDRVYASTQRLPFRIVQPWGPDRARQATLISEHATAAEAFREIDRLAAQMIRTGAPSDAVEPTPSVLSVPWYFSRRGVREKSRSRVPQGALSTPATRAQVPVTQRVA